MTTTDGFTSATTDSMSGNGSLPGAKDAIPVILPDGDRVAVGVWVVVTVAVAPGAVVATVWVTGGVLPVVVVVKPVQPEISPVMATSTRMSVRTRSLTCCFISGFPTGGYYQSTRPILTNCEE